MVYKNLAAIDLKNDSTVQYTRNLQDLVGAVCTPTILAHPIVNSYADTFARIGGGFQDANWRNIFEPTPTVPGVMARLVRMTGSDAEWFTFPVANATPPAPDNTVDGSYIAASPANNWHVRGHFAGGTFGNSPPDCYLAAPISQLNPADPNPSELQITCFFWSCGWISGPTLGVDARFQFQFFRLVNGVLTAVGGSFISAPGAFNVGSTWEFYCLCNNAPNPPNSAFPTTLIGLVDGVTRVTVANTFNVPAGVPGILSNGHGLAGETFRVSLWTADELSD